MFIIMHKSGLYFHNKGRIILYESEQEARNFLQMFIQYSTNRFAQEGNMDAIMQVPIVVMHECEIKSVDFDIDNIKCGTVLMKELFDNMER